MDIVSLGKGKMDSPNRKNEGGMDMWMEWWESKQDPMGIGEPSLWGRLQISEQLKWKVEELNRSKIFNGELSL